MRNLTGNYLPHLQKLFFISLSAYFLPLFCLAQKAERFHSFTYSVNEGLLQSTIYDIAIDKNNYCWISFPNGIQKFDGKNFIRIPVQQGLPNDTRTRFFQCGNGDLLISHLGGISKYEIEKNGFRILFGSSTENKAPFYFLEEHNGIVYLLNNKAAIIGLNSQTGKQVSTKGTVMPSLTADPNNSPTVSNISESCIAIAIQNTIYLWNLDLQKLIASYTPPVAIVTYSSLMLHSGEIIFNTYNDAYQMVRYNFTTASARYFSLGISTARISRMKMIRWKQKQLLYLNNRLFIVDSSLQITGEMLNFQNLPFTPNNSFSSMVADNFGNLYLSTVMNGMVKIMANNYPVKYFGSGQKAQNHVISILPDKKEGRLLAGTTGGLLIFDKAQQLVHSLTKIPGKEGGVLCNIIIKDRDGGYLVSMMDKNGGIYKLSKDFSSLRPLTAKSVENHLPSYFGNLLFQNDGEVLIQTQAYLYKIKPAQNAYWEYPISTGYVLSGLYHNNTVIAHAFDELIFLNAIDFKIQRRIPFPNTGDVRCYAADKRGRIYLGTNNGIFVIDENGKVLQRHTIANGLPDNCIYAMAFDEEELLWCSSNKGLFRMNGDGSFLQLTKEDGLQENEFNTNAVAVAEDGEMFFGGVNGISSFYPSAIKAHSEKLNIFLTDVKANNKDAVANNAVFQLQSLELPHDKNTLSFDFVAMGSSNPDQYIYQYRMKEVDEEWIQNDGMQTVRYSLLPGRYVFQLYASRVFDKKAKPMHELVIVITPPFWQTWWFRIAAIVLAAAIVGLVVNRRNKNVYRKKLAVLEAEHQLQLQRERISRDLHDNIGAYANAVLYKTELLERHENDLQRMELMADLKFASKDIITSLRETVWAFKKEEYTAEDCLLRIRNFMQTLSRYYPPMQFHVHAEAPPEKHLHYTVALNVVRIAQEIITNAVKHSSASAVHLSNTENNGHWILTFSDDGEGFDESSMPAAQKGEGLANLRKRAAESALALLISSERGYGTTITLSVP